MENIHKYDKIMDEIKQNRKKQYNNYYSFIHNLRNKNETVKHHKEMTSKKSKVIQILLNDLKKQEKKVNMYEKNNTINDIKTLTEYLNFREYK
ncbi:hypothetical protein CL656_07205 [bacterium]|nr:hypothetical protein [bacterium]